jgi:hypothetical protein
MGDGPRTPQEQEERRRRRHQALKQLADACADCWKEFGQSEGRNVLDEIPHWPAISVVEVLGQPRPTWPKPIKDLYEAAQQQIDTSELYDGDYFLAMNSLLIEARKGNLRLYGRRHPGLRMTQIDSAELNGVEWIDQSFKHLEAPPGGTVDERGFSRPIGFYDVEVDEADLLVALGKRDAAPERTTLSSPTSQPSDEALLQWIHHPDRASFRELHGAEGHGRQVKELKRHFPHLKDARKRLAELNKQRPFRRPRGHPKAVN